MPKEEIDLEDLDEGYDDLDIAPSRFSMMTGTLVVIGVVSMLIFAGVVWYAYNAGITQAEQETLPVVKADPGAIKVKPEEPGGANFAHQDKTVYDKIDGNEAGLEQLLPGSEEPIEKPRIISPHDNELPQDGQPKVMRVPPPATDAQPAAPTEAPEIAAPEIPDPMGRAMSGDEQPEVAAQPAPDVTSAIAEENANRVRAIPGQEDGDAKAPDVATSTDPAKPATQPLASRNAPPLATSGGKAFVLQLGAFRSQEAADAGWKLLATRHAGILGGLQHYVQPADLGDRGRFFRLQAGPFSERAAANTQCAALKSAGVDCLVAAR